MNKVKLFFINHRNTIRLLRYTLISVILVYITWFFDLKHPELKAHFPQLILLTSEVSSGFLSTLAGVFLTVTTFTFTTILTVINNHASSFTPRIVQDFIDRPNVLSLLGMFVGGFFYSVLALFMLQNIDAETLVLSGSLAVFYAIASMISFILFVIQVIHSVKTNNVIEDVYQRSLVLIEEEAEKRRLLKSYEIPEDNEEVYVYAQETGYLYDIDAQNILNLLGDREGALFIYCKIGEYIPKGMYVAKISLKEALDLEEEEKNDLLGKIGQSFTINMTKNDREDYHQAITTLVEIALTALSPGINDPNTAIICIQKISQLLGKLFSTENTQVILKKNDNFSVIYNTYSVQKEIYMTFNQIIFYGKGDPSVSSAILEGIFMIYMISSPSAKKSVMNFFSYAYESLYKGLETELDKKAIENIKDNFEKNRNRLSDNKAMRKDETA